MQPGAHVSYWVLDRKNSHFPADITISKIRFMYIDEKGTNG